MRSTLQALQDRLPPDEAVHLGAQLPNIVRGAYYEGWKNRRQAVEDADKRRIFSLMEKLHNALLP